MSLNINDRLYGFTVTRIRDVEEFGGQLIEMTHDRTGAGLVWAKSSEENKLFSVGFRTLPEDSTGVFHILEHSVLCGSENYPVREPFVELLKTSMNTFLNAMTFPDKTLYPVSSRMEQDYLNLMGVYLDAVFRPNILHDPNIFYQEGWHIDTAGDKPVYKGVVFNEMKGAMSDVDQIAERNMCKLLFPDTCYGHNSGGDPEAIPDLTYDDFIARYKKYYHPSNSYFYLDGNIPLEATLEKIDSYLSGYDRLEYVPEIVMQEPRTAEATCSYEVSDDNGKPVVMFGRIIGTWEDRDKLLALSVMTEQLADSNESPLKRAVLSSGLAEDMEVYISDGLAQPYLVIMFRGADPDNADRLIDIVTETTRKVLDEGIPEKDLLASVNQLDFRFRQYPEPQGLYRAISALNSWLYGGDPVLYLRSNEAIANLRALVASGEAAQIAAEYMTDKKSFSRITVLPSVTLGEEKAAAETARVDSIVSAMDEQALHDLEDLNAKLLSWQETPDSDEALASIPQLDLKDVNRTPELIGTDEQYIDGVRTLYHPVTTNGIVYLNAYFPVTDLSLEDIPAAALISEFYNDLPTENYSLTALQNEIRTYIGTLSFGLDILARDNDNASCTPCLRARAAVLRDNIDKAEDLIIEILTRTKFDDKPLMKELVTQIDEDCKRAAITSGHKFALYAARSHYSARDAAAEAANGYTFNQFMHGMNEDFDSRIDRFTGFAQDLIARSVVRTGAVISVTASEPVDISRFIGMFAAGEQRPAAASYTSTLPHRMGIVVPASVSHAIQTYDLSAMGVRPRGSISVAANILSLSHLWNEIRVKGGAYGASVSAGRTGSLYCYSYRDPSPARSLDVYSTIPDFLTAFADSEDAALDGFIISTVASTEPLITPGAKGRSADDFWLSGFTDEDRIRVRREILETTANELRSWRDAFKGLAADGSICVIGPKSALESCPDLEIVSI
ncbi:MAG: insulinase family protein [Mogibacterium sp.]|nr:insulinase family protein [Mogibacterium sp.]